MSRLLKTRCAFAGSSISPFSAGAKCPQHLSAQALLHLEIEDLKQRLADSEDARRIEKENVKCILRHSHKSPADFCNLPLVLAPLTGEV